MFTNRLDVILEELLILFEEIIYRGNIYKKCDNTFNSFRR